MFDFCVALLACWLAWRLVLEFVVVLWDWTQDRAQCISIQQHRAQREQWLLKFPTTGSLCAKPSKDKHLFGLKTCGTEHKLNFDAFSNVIALEETCVHVQANIKLYELLRFLTANKKMLKNVPDMDHLTLAGLYSGIGGGATSFRHGAFYCNVRQLEVVTSTGEVLLVNARKHKELFELMPSSLATLGYVLSFWLDVVPAMTYVLSSTTHFESIEDVVQFFAKCMDDSSLDFLDGVAFGPNDFVVIEGRMRDDVPKGATVSDTRIERVYYEQVKAGFQNRLSPLHDFIYRWDKDGYFSTADMSCITRNTIARKLLFHKGLMRGSRLRKLFCKKGPVKADVCDFVIPWDNAADFFREMTVCNTPLFPVYLCPITFTKKCPFIRPAQQGTRALDFGFGYGVTQTKMSHRDFIREGMHAAYAADGDMLKYASVYDKGEFWTYYSPTLHTRYKKAKQAYDPGKRLPGIDQKLRMH